MQLGVGLLVYAVHNYAYGGHVDSLVPCIIYLMCGSCLLWIGGGGMIFNLVNPQRICEVYGNCCVCVSVISLTAAYLVYLNTVRPFMAFSCVAFSSSGDMS